MAALNALDQRLEPEAGEHLADPGQTGKGMIEEHPAEEEVRESLKPEAAVT